MQNPTNPSSGGIAFRRRAASLAVASLFAAAGAAQAFEIDTGNEDLAMRWDNTFRYNLGVRAQGQNSDDPRQPELRRRRPQFLQRLARHQPARRAVRVRRRLAEEVRHAGERAPAGTTPPTAASTTPTRRPPTRWSTACRWPACCRPYTKRYAKGASGEWLDAFVFANFDIGDVPVNVKAGQHTVYWGDSLLLGGAVHGVSYAQNSLDVWKGFATPGTEAKELFRPRGGLTLQAQPTKDLSIAGQWFYNWQAVRVPESGSYLTVQRRAAVRRRFGDLQPNPFAGADSGRAGVSAALERQHGAGVALPRQPRRLGPVRALEPAVARRHAGLLLPQRHRHPAAARR